MLKDLPKIEMRIPPEILELLRSEKKEDWEEAKEMIAALSPKVKDDVYFELFISRSNFNDGFYRLDLIRRFPEIEYETHGERMERLEFKPSGGTADVWRTHERIRDAHNMQIWWEANRDRLEYKEDGTHTWVKEPIYMSELVPNELTPLPEYFLKRQRALAESRKKREMARSGGNNSLSMTKRVQKTGAPPLVTGERSRSSPTLWMTLAALLLGGGSLVFWVRRKAG